MCQGRVRVNLKGHPLFRGCPLVDLPSWTEMQVDSRTVGRTDCRAAQRNTEEAKDLRPNHDATTGVEHLYLLDRDDAGAHTGGFGPIKIC